MSLSQGADAGLRIIIAIGNKGLALCVCLTRGRRTYGY